MRATIRLKNYKEFKVALRKAPQRTTQILRSGLEESLFAIQAAAQSRAPVDTGRLRSSLAIAIRGGPGGRSMVGVVGTRLHYAPYMEFGTGALAVGPMPGKGRHWPPGDALEVWARRHGFESGYQVARIIGQRGGLRPRLFLTKAFKDKRKEVRSILRGSLREIVRKII